VRTEARVVGYLAIVLGTAAFLVGWSSTGEGALTQSAGAVIVAGLALLGAAAGLSTWQEERRLAREQQQREAYVALVLQLVSRFNTAGPGGWNAQDEARVRSQIAVWGAIGVVAKVTAWHAVYDRHVPANVDGQVPLTAEAMAAFEIATAEVVQAVRTELLPGDTASVQQLTRVLFNTSIRT
jgi:hypothetical protein